MSRAIPKIFLLAAGAAVAAGLAFCGPRRAARFGQQIQPVPVEPQVSLRLAAPGIPDGERGGVSPFPRPAAVSVAPPCASRPTLRPLQKIVAAVQPLLDTLHGIASSDGGAGRGHLNQHKLHWRRGCRRLAVEWPWPESTNDHERCALIAVGNWLLDAPEILARAAARGHLTMAEAERLARLFRLPSAPDRADNDEYWARVRARLDLPQRTQRPQR